MAAHRKKTGTKIRTKITRSLISGALLLTPFAVTLLVMRWLFGWVAGLIRPIVVAVLKGLSHLPVIKTIPQIPTAICVTVVTIVVLLFFVYLVGAIGQRMVGKRMLKAGETLLLRIPLLRKVYSATKQVVEAVSMPDKAAFKSVVLVDFPRPGFKAIGFLTGRVQGPSGEPLCKIYVPHAPILTTGFLEIVPPDEVTETNLTIEDGFKMILSGGMISPDILSAAKPPQSTGNPEKK